MSKTAAQVRAKIDLNGRALVKLRTLRAKHTSDFVTGVRFDTIRDMAQQFKNACELLELNEVSFRQRLIGSANLTRRSAHDLRAGTFFTVNLAQAVFLSFTIELGLKALQVRSLGGHYTGHHLRTLFRRLDQKIQNRIIEASDMRRPQFIKLLVIISNSFEELRYFHQTKQANFSPNFAFVLIRAINEMLGERPSED